MVEGYVGKRIGMKVYTGNSIETHEGVLVHIERSKHGGLGDLTIKNGNRYKLIRGSYIDAIVLEF